ncbi:Hypothetical predicted protein [Pelobates cultripes]|uniref:DUF4515 domain-containing protein n=1 Tax=Pelobates cultripes TaxID=61616 RepID=A0AAD1S2H0_PELCU|nr:Hypothetical predicted protein [Pelobates cultripes]
MGDLGVSTLDSLKEKYLQEDLNNIAQDINCLTKAISSLKEENDFLNEESDNVERENKGFTGFLSKRAERLHGAAISLNEYNHRKLQEVKREKEEMVQKLQMKETEMRNELMDKEHALSVVLKKLEELQPYKDLEAKQTVKIEELSQEIIKMRKLYIDKEREVKHTFLKNKELLAQESRKKVARLSRRAKKQAILSLQAHIEKVKEEHFKIRDIAARLCHRNMLLYELKCRLQRHNHKLLDSLQYQERLYNMRHTALHQRNTGQFTEVEAEREDVLTTANEKVKLKKASTI